MSLNTFTGDFGKRRPKAISRVECRENGVLIQVTNKEDIEHVIIKENAVRFKLAYSLPISILELSNDFGRVGEGRLS